MVVGTPRIGILLVEDNPRTAGLAMEQLSNGFGDGLPVDVLRAPDLRAAEEAIRTGKFNACVLDLHLPDSQGAATVSAIRRAAPNLPIVVLSAADDPEITTGLAQAGADGFVSKWLKDPLDLTKHILRILLQREGITGPLAEEIRRRLAE